MLETTSLLASKAKKTLIGGGRRQKAVQSQAFQPHNLQPRDGPRGGHLYPKILANTRRRGHGPSPYPGEFYLTPPPCVPLQGQIPQPADPGARRARAEKGLEHIPEELVSGISKYLGDADLIRFSTGTSVTMRLRTDYDYTKRFFTTVQVRVTADGLRRIREIAQSRFATHIQTIMFISGSDFWPMNDPQAQKGFQLVLWSTDSLAYTMHPYSPKDCNPLTRVFDLMQGLKNIGIHCGTYVDQYGHSRTDIGAQDAIIECVLHGIHQSNFHPQGLEIRNLPGVGRTRHVSIPALFPERISPHFQCYAHLRSLHLEYGQAMSLIAQPIPALSLLQRTPQLENLTLAIIESDMLSYSYGGSDILSQEILWCLSQPLAFQLKSLELKGLRAISNFTVEQTIRAHIKALRRITLQDVTLGSPNTTRALFTALAEADNLEYVALNKFSPMQGRYMVSCYRQWSTVTDELDWEETNEYGLPKDRSYQDWEWIGNDVGTPDEWVTYDAKEMDVKGMMQELVLMVKCGAL